MEDPERRRERRVAQVGVEVGEMVGRAERLVRDRAEGERGHVRARHGLGTPASAVGAELERVVVEPFRPQEDQLLDRRPGRPRLVAERLRRDGHLPPAAQLEALRAASALDRIARVLVPQEDHRQSAARLRT